jgi:hypothetical protein
MRRPRTKAEWLRSQFAPDDPTFPLHPEINAEIPRDLPGKIPRNMTELFADVTVAPRAVTPSRPRGDVPYDVSTDE